MKSFKSLFKYIFPESLLLQYHHFEALVTAFAYGFPSRKLVIIGVTGTKGKTTTANIRIGENESLNPYHMTMPGPRVIQKFLAQMVKEGCTHVIVETTSEGIKQWRHAGIWYDVAVFTNLTPEHLQAHGGSFNAYREAKGMLFKSLMQHPAKIFLGKKVDRAILVNNDSSEKTYFFAFPADKKMTFGKKEHADWMAKNIQATETETSFDINEETYLLKILGEFNVVNALPAIAIASQFSIPPEKIRQGLRELTLIPGRMEKIDEGQPYTVLVDYAHEKESMTAVLNTAKTIVPPGAHILVLLGAEGGGRDKVKRPIMGTIAAEKADVVIVSNVDPYEDDPQEILEDIAIAAEMGGKIRDKNLFVIADRREGIQKALLEAKEHDIVLITGKGAEQSIVIDGIRSPWDDRDVVREELKKLKK